MSKWCVCGEDKGRRATAYRLCVVRMKRLRAFFPKSEFRENDFVSAIDLHQHEKEA